MIEPTCFIQSQIDNRIDVHYYNPDYYNMMKKLTNISNNDNKFSLYKINDLLLNERFPLTGGMTPKNANYVDDGITFLRIQNIRENKLVLDHVKFIEKRIHEKPLKRSQLKTNDVLLTITGTYGISAIVPKDILPANINQHVVLLRVNLNKIDPRYILLFLNSKLAKIQMDRMVTGGTRPALDYPSIKDIEILFPTKLSTQITLINKIHNLQQSGSNKLSKSYDYEKMYDKIILEELNITIPDESSVKTFVIDYDDDDDRLDARWNYPYYSKILKILNDNDAKKLVKFKPKLTYGASTTSDYYDTVPFLRINNLRRFNIDLQDIKFISSELHKNKIANLQLQKDDILIARSGSVGLCGYITSKLENYVYGSYMIRLRMPEQAKKILLPKYLYIYLNSILGQLQFEKLKTGSLQYNINAKQIKEIYIIIPDKSTQQTIIDKINNLLTNVSTLKEEGNVMITKSKNQFLKAIISE